MKYLLLLAVVATVAAAFVIGGPPSGDAAGGPLVPRRGGTYLAPLAEDPPTLDPALAEDTTSMACVLQLFDTLVRFGDGNRIVPSLAERWEVSTDQRTYTFVLRRGVRFHGALGDRTPTLNGGRQVVAADVVYSFERVLRPSTGSPRAMLFQGIEGAADFVAGRSSSVSGLRAVSDHVLRVTLAKPFAPFLATLTMPNAAVVPREDAEGAVPLTSRPVGTGPFVFAGYRPGEALFLVASEEYFAGRPFLDALEFRVDPDETRQFRRFLAGELYHTTVPDPEYARTRTSPAWAPYFTEVSSLGTYYLGMNVRLAPFDDPRVRRAVSQAIDKDAIVKYIRAGRVLQAKGPLPPGIPGYNTGLRVPGFDPDEAGRILDGAGFPRSAPDGPRLGLPPLELHIPRGGSDMRVARAVQANLADLGLVCVPLATEWRHHLELVNSGRAAFFRLGWTADYLDPDNFLYYEFHSSNLGVSNTCSYVSTRVDDLLDAARATMDEERRRDLYQEAEQLIVDDCVWICLYYYNAALVRQPFVHGLNLTPLGEHMIRFDRVWLDERTSPRKEGLPSE